MAKKESMIKLTLFVVIVFCSVAGKAQDSSKTTRFSAIWILEDTSKRMIIEGDTIALIRQMYKNLEEAHKTIMSKDSCIAAAVKFSNNVPAYWNNSLRNCGYVTYQKFLKKNGYVKVTYKKYKPCR